MMLGVKRTHVFKRNVIGRMLNPTSLNLKFRHAQFNKE